MLLMKFPQYFVFALEVFDGDSVENCLVSELNNWSPSEGQYKVHIQQSSIMA